MNYGKMKKQVLRGVARQSNLKKAATSVQRQDKMYRPDRDGPKRVAQTLPKLGGRPMRGALASRPWRPKRRAM